MNFILYDLEATCWEHKRASQTQEIIEIGAVKLDRYGDVTGEFSQLIKPVFHPTLSIFCKNLTSIEQAEVNAAPEFPAVAEDFMEWIGYYDDEEYLLCSWGFFDQKALIHDCDLHKLDDEWVAPHISIKHQYRSLKGLQNKTIGLNRALRREGFEFEGTPHRGFDDASNMAKIFVKYMDEWVY